MSIIGHYSTLFGIIWHYLAQFVIILHIQCLRPTAATALAGVLLHRISCNFRMHFGSILDQFWSNFGAVLKVWEGLGGPGRVWEGSWAALGRPGAYLDETIPKSPNLSTIR